MNIQAEVSNRHVHLTKEDLETLFGEGFELTKRNDLSQIGEFASEQLLIIKTDKSEIKKVRVLGPVRNYSQVEISKTDSYTLGLKSPVRNSGDLEGAEVITMIGPRGEVTKPCCIIAARHIHIHTSDNNFEDGEVVSVEIGGEKGGRIDGVHVKKADNYVFRLHLDTDDGNAFCITQNQIVKIVRR